MNHPRLEVNIGHLINVDQNELGILICNTCFGKHKFVHALSHGLCTCAIPMMLKVTKQLDKIKHVLHAFIVCNWVPMFQHAKNVSNYTNFQLCSICKPNLTWSRTKDCHALKHKLPFIFDMLIHKEHVIFPNNQPQPNNNDLVTPNTLLEAFQNYQELLTTLYIATNQPKQFGSPNTIIIFPLAPNTTSTPCNLIAQTFWKMWFNFCSYHM